MFVLYLFVITVTTV